MDIQELQLQLQKAQEDSRLKSMYLSNMSHDLRTPINAIVGFAHLIGNAQDEAEKKEYLEIIDENNRLITQLINDILDMSKIESGKMELSIQSFDLMALMQELYQSSSFRMHNELVKLYLDNKENSFIFQGDRVRIHQIFCNLITNAIKFTNIGTIAFGFEPHLEDETIFFYVKDTGRGIEKEKLDTVFERYVRITKSNSGFGLGLAICKKLVELMEGEIGVESVLGKGSTFWFKLPYKQEKNNLDLRVVENKSDSHSLKEDAEEKPLILVAEDDSSNYRLVELILRKHYRLIHAWDGQEAIQKYQQNNPALILMDINMPNINGYQAFEQIRRMNSLIPIIAVTAYAMANEEREILDAGFSGYLSKPIDESRLLKLIKQALS